MRRYLPRLIMTGALLTPATLYALGLGEIRLNSALNQPFDAEIELLSPTPEDLASLKVGLAPNDMFARYGLDRPAFLSNFDFSVARTRDGRTVIKITSSRSVTEPFVTLLVEANSGRGRLLREYTVLLDPPTFMPTQPEQPAAVAAPRSGTQTGGRIERAPEPAPQPQPALAPRAETPAPAEPVAAAGGTYTVQRNDTLWNIASSINPGSRRVVNQTMIALYRANPDAFGGNINVLRAGSVLRIPDLAEIQTIGLEEASAEVARHTQEWTGNLTASTPPADSSRLRLVPPEETPPAPAPAPPTQATQPPAEAQAGSTSGTQTQEDRRLEVESPGLAQTQQQAEPSAEAPVAPETEPVAEATEPPSAEAEEPAPAPQPAPAPAPAAQEPEGPSLVERIGQFWWVFVVGGLLVVLGLVLTILRRRRENAELAEVFESTQARDESAPTRLRAQPEPFAVQDEEPEEDFSAPPATTRAVEPEPQFEPEPAFEPAATKADDTLSAESAVRFDQQDALAEADFHMAYGLYDQAADLVKIAISREPERRDLKLKLLEIYFVWGNKDLFRETARELYESRDQAPAGEWDKVVIMGKQIAPDDAMFQGDAASPHVDLVDVNLEGGENRVDLDLFAEPPSEAGNLDGNLDMEFASGERPAPESANASDLDFLLDEPKASEEEPTREMDRLARTQETPTIESPMIDRTAQTIREKIDNAAFAKSANGADQTAELSLDDLGLDVDALESTSALEDTGALDSVPSDETEIARPLRDDEMTQLAPSLRDDEKTQLAPSLGSFDRTLEAPRPEKFDSESTGTIYIDQVDFAANPGDTVEQPRPDVDQTASLKQIDPLDVDFDALSEAEAAADNDTVQRPRDEDQPFTDVFGDGTSEVPKIDLDLDVGDALSSEDHAPTNRQAATEMELSELEPVTMSEVGTKLDLARAYMDMGDPDGARSILEEVLQEGNPNQKQEAQRLIDSIR
jgi:pilus assembly protein FimV